MDPFGSPSYWNANESSDCKLFGTHIVGNVLNIYKNKVGKIKRKSPGPN